MGEASDAYSLLSRVRDCEEELAMKKKELERVSKTLEIALSKAQRKVNHVELGVAELLPQDFVCIELEVEWPDDKKYYRAFVCDARNTVHLLCYVDEQCGTVTMEELALLTTYRKWRFAVPRKHEDHLVGRRCIIDPSPHDTEEDKYKKTVFVLARREAGGIVCPDCKLPSSGAKQRNACPVHHTIIFVEDRWVTHFNFANNDYLVTRTSH